MKHTVKLGNIVDIDSISEDVTPVLSHKERKITFRHKLCVITKRL